jgi:hypothetical protein
VPVARLFVDPAFGLGDLVYHAWDPAGVGVDPPGRTMWLSELIWDGDKPVVQPPARQMPGRP